MARFRYAFGSAGGEYGGKSPEDYQLSRSAQRARYGSRAIDASAPQAANDTMAGLSPVGVMGGRTPNSTWNSWFNSGVTASAPPASGAMSAQRGSSLFDQSVPFVPKTRDDYMKTAFESATKWFDAQGIPIPQAGPRKSGDNFTSQYGAGSVRFGYEPKLKALGMFDSEDEWGL